MFAGDSFDDDMADIIPDALTVERNRLTRGEMVGTVRDVLAGRLS